VSPLVEIQSCLAHGGAPGRTPGLQDAEAIRASADATAVQHAPQSGSRRIAAMRLQRVVVRLAGADAHGVIEPGDENFSVADLSGLGSIAYGRNDPGDLICRHGYVNP